MKDSKTKKELLEEILSLNQQIEESNNKANELNDKYLRALADYQNLKKHSFETIKNAEGLAKVRFLNDLKPFIDSVFLAHDNGELEAVYGSMINSLHAAGFNEFGSVGDKFDESRYNAVSLISTGEVDSGCVAKVLNKGWMYGDDRVAIYSNVLVEQ